MNTPTMEQYRKRLKSENLVIAVSILALLTIQILSFLQVVQPPLGSRFAELWNGFIAGAALGIMIIMLIGLIRNLRAMKSDQSLQKLYNKNYDERTLQICAQGQAQGARLFVLMLLPACIISGYFNTTVFFTAIVAELALAVCMTLGKLYYKTRM